MITNQKYWQTRFSALEDNLHEIAQSQSIFYKKHMEMAYAQALDDIQKEISMFYSRFMVGNGLTKHEAYKLLNSKERIKFQMTLENYIAKGKETNLSPYWIKKLENASEVYHISRLEALQFQIRQQVEILHTGMIASTGAALSTLYQEGYLRTAYELQMGSGIGAAFAQLNQGQIDKVLARPWAKDGLDFSERIWGKYRPLLTHELETTLTQGIIRGKASGKIMDAMAKNMGVARERTATLVMTESAFIASSAQMDCMNKLDVEKYEIVSALGPATCKLCGERDGKVYSMKEYYVGDTAPPFHPNCRCTTAPYFNDEFTQDSKRAARAKNGKTELVSADTTYEQWKQRFVTESDDLAGKVRRGVKGAASGRQLVPFEELPRQIQTDFRNGLKTADSAARTVIERELQNLDFFISDSKSVFNGRLNAIGIKLDASPDTLAHEIFHYIDKAKGVTARYDFTSALRQDYERLLFLSEGNVTGYLMKQYPMAFFPNNSSNNAIVTEQFRGISDIFSGLTNNHIYLGYGHKNQYWDLKNTRLPKEAWAQYGRIKFDNNAEVLNMLEWLFPSFSDYAKMALKELV